MIPPTIDSDMPIHNQMGYSQSASLPAYKLIDIDCC
jgi:hypothetical protein